MGVHLILRGRYLSEAQEICRNKSETGFFLSLMSSGLIAFPFFPSKTVTMCSKSGLHSFGIASLSVFTFGFFGAPYFARPRVGGLYLVAGGLVGRAILSLVASAMDACDFSILLAAATC